MTRTCPRTNTKYTGVWTGDSRTDFWACAGSPQRRQRGGGGGGIPWDTQNAIAHLSRFVSPCSSSTVLSHPLRRSAASSSRLAPRLAAAARFDVVWQGFFEEGAAGGDHQVSNELGRRGSPRRAGAALAAQSTSQPLPCPPQHRRQVLLQRQKGGAAAARRRCRRRRKHQQRRGGA